MKNIDRKVLLVVSLFAFLIYFAHTRTFGLMFDGLTYAALAKNILKTGDWKMLHYGDVYPDFFFHPPLMIWVQAIIFKCLGSAEWVARILPASLALFTTIGVFLFAHVRFGLHAAFWSSIALITSTRYIKWGTNFYLDGPVAFFCFASFALWLWSITEKEKTKKADWFSFFSGVSLAGAFMTKGIVSSPTLVAVPIALIFFFSLRNISRLGLFILGAALPLCWWIFLFGGKHYLSLYFSGSAFARADASSFNFQPWENLLKVWLPWWPVFIVGSALAAKQFFKKDFLPAMFVMAAISFPLAFSLNWAYLESYTTPFYPFAAIVVGWGISRFIKGQNYEKYISVTGAIVLVGAIFLATLSPDVNAQKDYPAKAWVREIKTLPAVELEKIKKIIFTTASGETYLNFASLMFRTDWEVVTQVSGLVQSSPHTIMVTKAGETVSAGWKKVPELYVEGNEFYIPKNGL